MPEFTIRLMSYQLDAVAYDLVQALTLILKAMYSTTVNRILINNNQIRYARCSYVKSSSIRIAKTVKQLMTNATIVIIMVSCCILSIFLDSSSSISPKYSSLQTLLPLLIKGISQQLASYLGLIGIRSLYLQLFAIIFIYV